MRRSTVHKQKPIATHKLRDCVVKLQKLSSSMLAKYCLDDQFKGTSQQHQTLAVSKNTLAVARNKAQSMVAAKHWNDALKRTTSLAPPKVGQIVLAKMRSYRPWPAVILKEDKKTVFWVRFLGKHSEGSVKKCECVLFENAIECVAEYLKNPVDDYNRAIREAEVIMGVPSNASVLQNK